MTRVARAATGHVDGRTARAGRTRTRIVVATIALVEAGDQAPTSRRIADEAGVSERSLFLHFPDLECLHAAVAEQHLEASRSRYRPIDPDLPLDDRLRRFTQQRGRLLEGLTPLRRVAIRYEPGSPALQRSRQRWNALARHELEHTFAAELGRVDDRRSTIAAAQAATSWAAWEELRTGQGLSRRVATAAMELALRRLLAGP